MSQTAGLKLSWGLFSNTAKKYGQHFLKNPIITERIVSAVFF